jgi:hypothetical protein
MIPPIILAVGAKHMLGVRSPSAEERTWQTELKKIPSET